MTFDTQGEGIKAALAIEPPGQVHVMGPPEQATVGVLCTDSVMLLENQPRLVFHAHVADFEGNPRCDDCGHMNASEA